MRAIRDRLSRQIEGMSFEEEKRFIRERLEQGELRAPRKPPEQVLKSASLRKRGGRQRKAAKAARG